jgi:hypothetical protein
MLVSGKSELLVSGRLGLVFVIIIEAPTGIKLVAPPDLFRLVGRFDRRLARVISLLLLTGCIASLFSIEELKTGAGSSDGGIEYIPSSPSRTLEALYLPEVPYDRAHLCQY